MSDETNPAALVEHQAEWLERASRLLSDVRDALREQPGFPRASFDHIGSTAVSGLPAKPFVDLQVRISPLPGEAVLRGVLEPLGYVRARGSRPDSPGVDHDMPRGSIVADAAVWQKQLYWHDAGQAILHIRRADSPWGLYTVWFRDWLRSEPDARRRYSGFKQRISAEQVGKTDYDDYTAAKTAFFDDVQIEFERWVAARDSRQIPLDR